MQQQKNPTTENQYKLKNYSFSKYLLSVFYMQGPMLKAM